jgi:hypothetical protein
MLKKEIQIDDNDLKFIDSLPFYFRHNLDRVFATLLYMFPKIGKDVTESYEKLKQLSLDFKRFHDSNVSPEGDILVDYLKKIEGQESSLYFNDIISRLINSILERLKEESKQENILVIDDLDRIDPEHIFRILNVFASHIDQPSEKPNRLGFDKIILVCDVKNIRNIFSSKYGMKADFNGYIDKFYSKEIFRFDNRQILTRLSSIVFANVKFGRLDYRQAELYSDTIFRKYRLGFEILEAIIHGGFVNLKSILKKRKYALEVSFASYYNIYRKFRLKYFDHPILLHFEILGSIVGDYQDLIHVVESLQNDDLASISDMQTSSQEFIYYLSSKEHKFENKSTVLNYYIGTDAVRVTIDWSSGKLEINLDKILDERHFRTIAVEFIELIRAAKVEENN